MDGAPVCRLRNICNGEDCPTGSRALTGLAGLRRAAVVFSVSEKRSQVVAWMMTRRRLAQDKL